MVDFIRNLVFDLREKRLLPVAVGLLLLAAVILLVLPKDGSSDPTAPEESSPNQPVSSESREIDNTIVIDEANEQELEIFEQKDPFVQQARGSKTSGSDSGSVTPPESDQSSSDTGSSGSVSAPEPDLPSGGGSVQPTEPVSQPPTTGEIDIQPAPTLKRETVVKEVTVVEQYQNAVWLTFEEEGKEEKKYDSLLPIKQLPSAEEPLVTFIGLSPGRQSAVFLLGDNTAHEGEGVCKPYKTRCEYLYMRPDKDRDRHAFYRKSEPGDPATSEESAKRYMLHVRKVGRVEVDSKDATLDNLSSKQLEN